MYLFFKWKSDKFVSFCIYLLEYNINIGEIKLFQINKLPFYRMPFKLQYYGNVKKEWYFVTLSLGIRDQRSGRVEK